MSYPFDTPKTQNVFDPNHFLTKTNDYGLIHAYALGAKFMILRKQLIYFFKDVNIRMNFGHEPGRSFFFDVTNSLVIQYDLDVDLHQRVNRALKVMAAIYNYIGELRKDHTNIHQLRISDEQLRDMKVSIGPDFEVLLDFTTYEYCVYALSRLMQVVYPEVQLPPRIEALANVELINQTQVNASDGYDGEAAPYLSPRIPTVIVFDNSLSCGESRRTEGFDNSFHRFVEQLAEHPVLADTAEVMLICCGGDTPRRVSMLAPISGQAGALRAYETKPYGPDCLADAILMALNDIESHREALDEVGVPCAVPRLIIFSDGLVCSDVTPAAEEMSRLLEERQLQAEVIGLGPQSFASTSLGILAHTISDVHRTSVLRHADYFFGNLIASMEALSQRAVGTLYPIPNFTSWAKR